MPPTAPVPITPEGKRAADKIRNVFACIVAANIALVAIVMWQGFFENGGASSAKDAVSVSEDLMERSIATYNAGDTRAFSALFTAGTPSDPAMHHAEYRRSFGKILGWKLISAPETVAGDGSRLVYEVTGEKEPHASLIVKITQGKDPAKLVEWKIERR